MRETHYKAMHYKRKEKMSLWASKYLNEANAGALEKVLDCF